MRYFPKGYADIPTCPPEVVNNELSPRGMWLLDEAGAGCIHRATYESLSPDGNGLESGVALGRMPDCDVVGYCRMQEHIILSEIMFELRERLEDPNDW
ncbi:MAG TPA: hypothetical protein VJP80_06085 [Candidatus Saccharimonadales bacterium]|nr:hypothetical protein [Candidatus Saccharimonadales bacterium]